MRKLIALAVAALSTMAVAATPPSFSIADGTVIEGNSFQPIATKSAVASSYSKITFTVGGGTCAASRYKAVAPWPVTVANKTLTIYGPSVQTIDNQTVEADCTILVKLTVQRNGRLSRGTATWTLKSDDVPPPPPPAPTGNWVAAPLAVGGYATMKQWGCCGGLIIQLARFEMSTDADPALRQRIWYGRYVADASGNFPPLIGADYWTSNEFRWNENDMIGLMPAAKAPATGAQPTYGDTVQAISACTGRTIPDNLVPGALYTVKGLYADVPIATNATPMNLPDGVRLNPTSDDGVHRGDGHFALTVPMSCVQKVTAPAMRLALASAPRAAAADAPILAATRDCRDIFNQRNPRNEDYNFVARGQRFRVSPSKTPGAVLATPINPALGTSEVQAACFK